MGSSPESRQATREALGRVERQTVKLSIATLEKRAAASGTVVISDRLARSIAGNLRRLLERGG